MWGKRRWRIRAPHELVFKRAGSFDAERCFGLASRQGYANHDFRWQHDLHESFHSKSAGQLYIRATRKHRSGYAQHTNARGPLRLGSCGYVQSRQLSFCIWNQFYTISSSCRQLFHSIFLSFFVLEKILGAKNAENLALDSLTL